MDILPGVRVDSFEAGAALYLLSHFHRDHTDGLGKGWSAGPLVASPETCLLLRKLVGVEESCLRPLGPGETVAEGGVEVTALEANHCPGSVMFHVRGSGGRGRAARGKRGARPTERSVLYTGDFRLDDAVREALGSLGPVDTLYVDSTYADPQYSFPTREEALERVVEIVREVAEGAEAGDDGEETEIMLAVYSIGKNCVVEAVSRALGRPVYLPARTRRVYELLGMGNFVTGDRGATNLRGYSRGYFDEHFFMLPRARRERAVVVIPTGWALDEAEGPRRRGGATFHYVPYSEHCDWAEREEAIRLVGAGRVVEI